MHRLRYAVQDTESTGMAVRELSDGRSDAFRAVDLQAVTSKDLQILELAKRSLSEETRWNRADTRTCLPGAAQLSLFCALHEACIEVLGSYDHRRAALQEVRHVIDERGKDYEHRLMGFNNDPLTSFQDVQSVLRAATDRIRGRLTSPE